MIIPGFMKNLLLFISLLVVGDLFSQDTLDMAKVTFEVRKVKLAEEENELFVLHSQDENYLFAVMLDPESGQVITSNGSTLPYRKIKNGDHLYVFNSTNGQPVKIYFQKSGEIQFNIIAEKFISLYLSSGGKPLDPFTFIEYGILFLLLFIGLVGMIAFGFLKNKEYLYYALYSLTIVSYIYMRRFYLLHFSIYTDINTDEIYLFTRLIQPVMLSFYILFSIHFLDMKVKYPFGYKVQRNLLYLSIASLLIMAISFYFNEILFYYTYDGYRIVMAVVSLFLVFYFISKKDILANYLVLGSLVLIIFQVIAMVLSFDQSRLWGLYPLAFVGIGAVLELLFFTMGIIQKSIKLVKEKSSAQSAHISQLKINQVLQRDKELELEKLISEARVQIEEEQKLKIESQLELQLVEAEMTSLHSQMNPHFLFNSLNSLKLHILKKDTKEAVQYLDKLSILIRNILRFSRKRKINLQDELDNVKLYMELENLRVRIPIEFSLYIEPLITSEFVEIPPLLLQPFIENSIWHGHANSDHLNPFIKLEVRQFDGKVVITIEDNGIGRKRAANFSSGSNMHNSIASEVTKKRINLINKGKGGFDIIDLYDNGIASGTKVVIALYEY